MPYMRVGNCIYKKKPDGSRGEKKGCSDSPEGAKKYMRKLYMEENKSLVELSMAIVKASIPDKASRTMRISMVNSDVDSDVFSERMSTELFEDFVERIETDSSVPEPFDVLCEDGWTGGMPYLSISHYKSGAGKNVPGDIERVYVDGERLKSNAVLYETPFGVAVWKAICADIKDANKPVQEKAFENPVRISIGFLDLEHKHEIEGEEDFIFTRTALKQKCPKCDEGINGKVYLKGQLVHLAFTRVPANPRTSVEVLRMSDEIETKKQDAESIVGKLADELVGKSAVEDGAMVVKADEESCDQKTEAPEKSEIAEEVMGEEIKPEVEEEVVEKPVATPPVEPQKSKVELAAENFLKSYAQVSKMGLHGDAAIEVLQPVMDELANVTKEAINPAEPLTKNDLAEAMALAMKSAMPDIVAQVLKAMPAAQSKSQSENPAPRSLFIQRGAPAETAEKSQIAKIAEGVAKQTII